MVQSIPKYLVNGNGIVSNFISFTPPPASSPRDMTLTWTWDGSVTHIESLYSILTFKFSLTTMWEICKRQVPVWIIGQFRSCNLLFAFQCFVLSVWAATLHFLWRREQPKRLNGMVKNLYEHVLIYIQLLLDVLAHARTSLSSRLGPPEGL